MDLKLLRSFVLLAEAGHYGKAADRLLVTQSTLTKQIQALEATIGGELFERGRHGAKLTVLGRMLEKEAQRLLRLSDDVAARMRRAHAGLAGHLDIAFGISTLVLAPRLIADFRVATPDCQITLDDLPSSEQHQRLLDGRLDAGFCRAPVDAAGLQFLPLLEERLALVLPPTVNAPPLSQLSALNTLGFVALSPSRGSGLDAQITRWCSASNFKPRIVQYAEDILTVHAIVAAGLGAAFLPWYGVEALGGRTHQSQLSGPESHWPIGLCWRDDDRNPLLRRFIDHISNRGSFDASLGQIA